MDRNGEFQLEFNLSNIRSIFEHKFKINQSIFNNIKLGKLETSYFSFDQYDWSLSVYPSGRADSQLGELRFLLGGTLEIKIAEHPTQSSIFDVKQDGDIDFSQCISESRFFRVHVRVHC